MKFDQDHTERQQLNTRQDENEYKQFEIDEEYCPHHNRFETPNILTFIKISDSEFRLYSTLQAIAGGDTAACWMTMENLAIRMNCDIRHIRSAKKLLAQPRSDLDNLPLIRIKKRYDKNGFRITDLITIVNIWKVNIDHAIARKKNRNNNCNSNNVCVLTDFDSTVPTDFDSAEEDPLLRRPIKKKKKTCVREADTVQALPFSASPLFSLFSDLLPKWDSQLKPITAWQDELHDICTKKNIDSNELIDILRWIDQSKDKFWTIKIKNPSSLLRNFEEIVKQYTNRKISKSSIANDKEKERSDLKHEFVDFLKSEREFYNASKILFRDKGVEINNIFYDYLSLNVKKIIANIIEIWKRSEKA